MNFIIMLFKALILTALTMLVAKIGLLLFSETISGIFVFVFIIYVTVISLSAPDNS